MVWIEAVTIRDRPLATHNAGRPSPRASARDAWGLGWVCASSATECAKNLGILNRWRWPA